MDYRLGLDLGTNSIGVVAVALKYDSEQERDVPINIVWHHSHIFSEPLNNTQTGLFPKAAERREARQKRRQLKRRKRRIKKIYQLASLLNINISKETVQENNKHIFLENSTKVPYLTYIRAKAAEERINLEDLLQIFSRMAKRRGYSGGFKTKSAREQKGPVEAGADLLEQRLNNQTLGQFLLERLKEGKPTRLKINQYYADHNLYALREHVEAEFEKIWETQSQHHKILNDEAICPIPDKRNHYGKTLPLKAIFKMAIFDQRPLKPFNDKIGLCELEPNLPRASKAQMAAQAFRIEKILADLMIGQGKKAKPLSPKQKTVIRELLNKQAEVSFEAIYKALNKADCPLPESKRFSINSAKQESLKGNTTLAGFKSLKLLDDWLALDELTQIQIINFWTELGSPEQLFDEHWDKKFLTWNKNPAKRKPRIFSEAFKEFINKLRQHEKFDRLSKVKHFEAGRSAYSIKALNNLARYMQTHDCNEYEAIGKPDSDLTGCYPEYHKNNQTSDSVQMLPPHTQTGNAVVDVALGQLQLIVNDCIDKLGKPPKEIIVEMSRDIKNGIEARNTLNNQNRKRETDRKKAAKDITESLNEAATPTNILKYELWNEQEHHCPYCNTRIGVNEVLDGSKAEFEHIIPRSKSKVGRKRSEIILAHKNCNALKGNRLPLLVPEFINDKQRKRAIENMAQLLTKKGKRLRNPGLLRKAQLLRLDDAEGLLDDNSIKGFSDWQLQDTSWIAKLAVQWLTCLVDTPSQISITKGGLTAYMRRHLGLDTVIPELRFQEGKSVLTKEGAILSRKNFESYKDFYNGHRWQDRGQDLPPTLDKRIDHRHHLIDAFIIALSDRKFVIHATKLHQAYCKKYQTKEGEINSRVIRDKMSKAIGHDLQAFKTREKALQFLKHAHITHRPDHNLAGKFYQDGAYQKVFDEEMEKSRLVIRKMISDLTVKGNIEKTLKKLNTIVKPRTREHIIAVFQKRIGAGQTPEEALSKPITQEWYGEKRPVFAVSTYYDRSADKADPIPYFSDYGKETKFLIPDIFAYFKLLFTDEGLVDNSNSFLVTLADHARNQVKNNNKPTQTAANEWRYYKGDTVVNLKTKERFIICKFKNDTSRYLFLAPLTETRNWDKISAKDSADKHIAFTVGIKQIANYKPEYLLQ